MGVIFAEGPVDQTMIAPPPVETRPVQAVTVSLKNLVRFLESFRHPQDKINDFYGKLKNVKNTGVSFGIIENGKGIRYKNQEYLLDQVVSPPSLVAEALLDLIDPRYGVQDLKEFQENPNRYLDAMLATREAELRDKATAEEGLLDMKKRLVSRVRSFFQDPQSFMSQPQAHYAFHQKLLHEVEESGVQFRMLLRDKILSELEDQDFSTVFRIIGIPEDLDDETKNLLIRTAKLNDTGKVQGFFVEYGQNNRA